MHPPPLPQAKKSPATLWIVLAAVFGAVFLGFSILAAILIPTIGKVRETARRTVDTSDLRQIVQASLLWAQSNNEHLPPSKLTADGRPEGNVDATITAVAAALARDGGLNEASMWFSPSDPAFVSQKAGSGYTGSILAADRTSIAPTFASQRYFAWDYATGLTVNMPPSTPVAWTRGLRTDGTWDESGVYGRDGGYIAFLNGTVSFFSALKKFPLTAPDGSSTENILNALPTTARIVGSGPGSLTGQHGLTRIPEH